MHTLAHTHTHTHTHTHVKRDARQYFMTVNHEQIDKHICVLHTSQYQIEISPSVDTP